MIFVSKATTATEMRADVVACLERTLKRHQEEVEGLKRLTLREKQARAAVIGELAYQIEFFKNMTVEGKTY